MTTRSSEPSSGPSSENNQIPIFSFADTEVGAISSKLIRGVEKISGQPRIEGLYMDYINDSRPDHLFWQDAIDRLDINVEVNFDKGAYIPKTGALLVIANHPFGVIDGLALCSEVSKVRQDYKIITHQVLRQAPQIMHQILPIDFDTTDEALKTNTKTRKNAIKQLESGGVLVIFPSGATSCSPFIIGRAIDPKWTTFTARLATIDNTTVLPIYFQGQNSLAFMLAKKISQTLSYSLGFREICRRIGSTLPIKVRAPVHSSELKRFQSRHHIIQHLRDLTYGDEG